MDGNVILVWLAGWLCGVVDRRLSQAEFGIRIYVEKEEVNGMRTVVLKPPLQAGAPPAAASPEEKEVRACVRLCCARCPFTVLSDCDWLASFLSSLAV